MCEALLLKRFSEIILADLAADFARLHAAARHLRRLRFAGLLTAARTAPASSLAEAIGCARILVLGAGGGLELKAFAEMQSSWHFDGVDSSAEMLDLARTTLGKMVPRVRLHEDYIDTAPSGPFDGATCLLALHFLQREERLQTLKQIRMRLKADKHPRVPGKHHREFTEQHGWTAIAWIEPFAAIAQNDIHEQPLLSHGAPSDRFTLCTYHWRAVQSTPRDKRLLTELWRIWFIAPSDPTGLA